ncbi:MAG: putative lipid II flippase FtsW [Spirochaetia bacterium]|nr:putative lipid II flippase FtsW [Spirochaetia bacterium]MCF7941052.1 putative lipid II flippase FtsW [Spirochaetia bacterium]
MKRALQETNTYTKEAGYFCFFVLLLLGIGLMSLYSASYDKALRMGYEPQYFFHRQLLFTALGIAGAAVVALFPEHVIKHLIPVLLFLSLILMALTSMTSLGETRMGATRWLRLGPLSFQPSELVKVAVMLYLANYLGKRDRDLKDFWVVSVPIAVVFLAAGLIIIQRDYSTTMVFLFLSFSMLLIAQVKITYLLYYLAIAGIPGIFFLLSEEYRLKRVIGFIFKDIDPSGINYQVNVSMDAIASGGILGKGFGQGTYKLGKIPEVQSDFIFAAFAEEWGLFGVITIILLFSALAYLGFRGAARHRQSSSFLFLTGFGISYLLLWQFLLNIGVAGGMVPPTGIPLPFFSAGGTNLLMNLGMCGLLLKIILKAPKEQGPKPETHESLNTYRNRITDYE